MNLNETDVLKRLGETYKLEPALVGAVIEVESGGDDLVQIGSAMLPVIRWEGHYFDKYVRADRRDKARKLKLASSRAGGIKNPASQAARYKILHEAMALDAPAALRSISMGIGQVMGAHAEKLGFKDPQHMFDYNCQGYEAQADTMMRYNVAFDLIDELQRHDFKGYARGYNGEGYAKGKYDTKIESAYIRLSGKAPVDATPGMIRMGAKGPSVREIQALLVRAGYALKVDSDFGPSTKAAVKAFQAANKLTSDGICGPETMKALTIFRQVGDKLAVPDLSKVKDALVKGLGSGTVIAVAKTQVEEVAKQVKGLGTNWFFDHLSQGLLIVAGCLAVAGLLAGAYQWYKANRS